MQTRQIDPSGRAHWRLRTRPRQDRGDQSIVRIAVVETAAIRSESCCSNSVGIYPRMASRSYHPALCSNTAALASARVAHDSPIDALRHHRTGPSGSAPGGWIRGGAKARTRRSPVREAIVSRLPMFVAERRFATAGSGRASGGGGCRADAGAAPASTPRAVLRRPAHGDGPEVVRVAVVSPSRWR